MAAFGEHDVEDRLDRITMMQRRNLGDGLALHVAQRILKRTGDQNAGAAARRDKEAFRLRVHDFPVQPGAGRRIAQPDQQRVPTSTLSPRGNRRIE